MATAFDETTSTLAIENEPEGLFEEINGQIVKVPPMGVREGLIASRLVRALNRLESIDDRGQVVFEMLFVLGRNLKRRPDVAFVSAERWPLDRDDPTMNAWDVVPDLAVEIVSPTNRSDYDMQKVEDYFRAGVRGVWRVYPRSERVYVYDSPTSLRILQAGDVLDGGTVLPGFKFPLSELLGEEPPAEA